MAGVGNRLTHLGEAASAPLGAWARMASAAASDLAGAATGRSGGDPFALRDPDYIRHTLPAWRLISEFYFRADVRGLDRIPAQGPVLLVGNHSGGVVIADTFIFAQAFYDHFGADRAFYQLAHDLVFKVAGARALVQRYGTVPASPANMATALHRAAALVV